MTWLEFAQKYKPNITADELEFILWNETAFPVAGLRYTVKQFFSALRRRKNNIKGCEFCGRIKCHCEQSLREHKDINT